MQDMQLIAEAANKALDSSTFLESLEKWKPYPVLYKIKKDGGKNAVGDFGENLVCGYYERQGVPSKIVKNGHDVLVGLRKKEVKTAFYGGHNFWFNQIYFEYPKTHAKAGLPKDWEDLTFVFVKPGCIEIWECERPQKPEHLFKWNNGWMWQKAGSHKLDSSCWKHVVTFNF